MSLNSMVLERWYTAHQTITKSNSLFYQHYYTLPESVSPTCSIIFSYREDWPIIILDRTNSLAIVNTTKVSVTTTKHTNAAIKLIDPQTYTITKKPRNYLLKLLHIYQQQYTIRTLANKVS